MDTSNAPVTVPGPAASFSCRTGEGDAFYVDLPDGTPFAHVWHSDRGEWTIETHDETVHRVRDAAAALDLCRRLIG